MRKVQRLVMSTLNGVQSNDIVSLTMEKFCYGFEFDLENDLRLHVEIKNTCVHTRLCTRLKRDSVFECVAQSVRII